MVELRRGKIRDGDKVTTAHAAPPTGRFKYSTAHQARRLQPLLEWRAAPTMEEAPHDTPRRPFRDQRPRPQAPARVLPGPLRLEHDRERGAELHADRARH